MRREDIAELDWLLPGTCEPIVDAPEQERQPLTEMAENELRLVLLEQTGEHEADRERRGLDGVAPGGAQEHGEVLRVLLIISVDHGRMRHRGVQVDRHVERLGARENRPIALVVDELALSEAVDHRALEAELLDAARKLIRRGRRIVGRQRRKTRVARRGRLHDLGEAIIDAAREFYRAGGNLLQ